MAKKIYMARMGQTMKEGVLTKWLKSNGDRIEKGDPIYEIEFDKSSGVAEAKDSGILQIIAEEGDTVAVSEIVGYLLEENETPKKTDKESNELKREELQKTVSAVNSAATDLERYKITPLAKRTAKDLNIDISVIEPADSVSKWVRKADVLAYYELGGKKTSFQKGVCVENASDAEEKTVKMSNMRAAIAARMKESYFTYPIVTYMREANADNLLALHIKLKNLYEGEQTRVTITDILIKTAAKAILLHPEFNVSTDESNIIQKQKINIGFAAAREDGLIVPVIKDTGNKSLKEIASERTRLVAAVKGKTAVADDISGGTFTISNLGMYGIEYFTPIINPPESAILGVGATVKKPSAVDGEIKICSQITFSLTADHRVIDGACAAEFMSDFVKLVEDPVLILGL